MARRFYNNTTATGSILAAGAGDLTFTASGFTGTPTTPFTAVVDRGLGTEEIVLVTNVTGGTLTVTRGYDGTSASSHGGGSVIEHCVAAEGPNTWDAHVAATTGIHGTVGALVDTASAQTLTNKTCQLSVYEATGTTSPGAGPLHKARVDTTGRQGFTADTTGTAAAGKGFTVEQSGADRWRVNADGSTLTNPSGSPTWAQDCTGNSRVTGAQTVTGILTVGSLTSGGAITGTASTVSGTAQQATSTTTGNATVGGTLGVTGASTLASAAVTGNETVGGTLGVTGATTLTTVTAGATGVASLASTGDVTGRGATTFTTLLEASAHGSWGTKIRMHDASIVSRSARQPVVHRINIAAQSVTINNTEVQLSETILTLKEDCQLSWALVAGFFVDAGLSGTVEPSESFLRLRLLDSGNVVKYDSGQEPYRVNGAYYNSFTQRNQPRVPVIGGDTTVWTAGSTVKVRLLGQKQTVLGMAFNCLTGYVQEVVVAT